MGGSWLVEIVVLAMIAGFIALRLYSVLGRRTGHEQPLGQPTELQGNAAPRVLNPAATLPRAESREQFTGDANPAAGEGLRAIAAADPAFDGARFVDGAREAYRLVLEAFWRGDREALHALVDDSVGGDFDHAIAEREQAGTTVENKLVRIDRARIEEAGMNGGMATITVRFDADIAGVTKDKAGNIVAGSMTDAVQTHDLWTFSRHVAAQDPNWLLVETDEVA